MPKKDKTGNEVRVVIDGSNTGQVAIGSNIVQSQSGDDAPSAEREPASGEGVRLLKVVVVSPSDVQTERDALDGVADELNRGVAADRSLRIDLIRWETHAHPGFATGGPQALIDPLIAIENADVVVGIFWRRLGTPTPEAPSGTAHELQRAYELWQRNERPQIMIYFNQAPPPGAKSDSEQWNALQRFRRELPGEGVYWDYNGVEDFTDLARTHLTHYIRARFRL